MNQITLIRQTLQPHLGWHGARISFLALFLVALFRVKTVNFSELAVGFLGKAQSALRPTNFCNGSFAALN
jgi:hypothetical protein